MSVEAVHPAAGMTRTIHEALLLMQQQYGVPPSLRVIRIRREILLSDNGPSILLAWGSGLSRRGWLRKRLDDRVRPYHTAHTNMLISEKCNRFGVFPKRLQFHNPRPQLSEVAGNLWKV